MGKCSQWGKKLRFFEGNRYRVQGNNELVRSHNFDFIDKDIEFSQQYLFLFKGKKNHKNDCYFVDAEKKNVNK